MSLLDNIQDVIFTTEFAIDKVCSKRSGSISVPTATNPESQTNLSVAHGLGFAPLTIAIYTDDPTWETYYVTGLPPYHFFPFAGLFVPRINVKASADSQNFYAYIQNTDTTRTVYVRFIGIIPHNITNAPELSPSDMDDILFFSEDNYCKVLIDSSTSISITGSTQTITVPHNLGYRPMAICHSLYLGEMYRSGQEFGYSFAIPYRTVASVNESNLTINVDSNTSGTVQLFYRIYLDN